MLCAERNEGRRGAIFRCGCASQTAPGSRGQYPGTVPKAIVAVERVCIAGHGVLLLCFCFFFASGSVIILEVIDEKLAAVDAVLLTGQIFFPAGQLTTLCTSAL